jgi:hypothetical protein
VLFYLFKLIFFIIIKLIYKQFDYLINLFILKKNLARGLFLCYLCGWYNDVWKANSGFQGGVEIVLTVLSCLGYACGQPI